MTRNASGQLDQGGQVWAVPYRWGCTMVACNTSNLCRSDSNCILACSSSRSCLPGVSEAVRLSGAAWCTCLLHWWRFRAVGGQPTCRCSCTLHQHLHQRLHPCFLVRVRAQSATPCRALASHSISLQAFCSCSSMLAKLCTIPM